jgi:hypothetical protein
MYESAEWHVVDEKMAQPLADAVIMAALPALRAWLGNSGQPLDRPSSAGQSDVFLLWHVRHAGYLDGSPTAHRDDDGVLAWDEEDGDDVKLLGAYSTEALAADRIERARQLPGFRDEPGCFQVGRYTVDQDEWTEGFVSIPRVD